MNKQQDFRYDPLYRVIDETEEMRIIEGTAKKLFERLRRINNLGIIPEVFKMAKYPKYEHELGTIHQISKLLETADKNTIPDGYRRSLRLASLFLHLGHLPFTYSSERALLLASNLGDRTHSNTIKRYLDTRIKRVLDRIGVNAERKQNILSEIFSMRSYDILYRYFSADILIGRWQRIKDRIHGLEDKELEIIIRDLIDRENDGYKYLDLADKADFVQRDALYFGTVRLDISPRHLYAHLCKYRPRFSVSEEKLVESNLDYLKERFYNNPEVSWFSSLYEKVLASMMISSKFRIDWLEQYDDDQFKRLITCNLDKDNRKAGLPAACISKTRELFSGRINFNRIFELRPIFFKKEKDVFDIEYELIGKKRSRTGLVTYPFNNGVLLIVNYLDEYKFRLHPDYNAFSISIFQNESKKNFTELLKIIKSLSHYISINHVNNIREALATQLSWTKTVRFANEPVINAVAQAIIDLEKTMKWQIGDFIEDYLKALTDVRTFDELWHRSENQMMWKSYISHCLEKHRDHLDKTRIYKIFVRGLLSLPTRLLQFTHAKKYLDYIYDILLDKISMTDPINNRGVLFEALSLIERIRTRKGKFQFFLNGMVVIDPEKQRNKQDENEFNVIELLMNDNEEAECWVYACSVGEDYKSQNKGKLTRLADCMHDSFPDLRIYTRYVIPWNKNAGNWAPNEMNAGRNY